MNRITFFVFVLALVYFKSCSSTTCYNCASNTLKAKWQLTGFPMKMQETLFDDDDAKCLINVAKWNEARVDCNSACLTLIIQDPETATAQPDQRLVVRGCHEQLIGWNPMIVDVCESGQVTHTVSKGAKVLTKAQFQLCNSDSCNSQTVFMKTGSCNTVSKTVTCNECESDSTCSGGHCSGRWCMRADADIGEKRSVVKGCSPINVYGKTACAHISTDIFVPTRASLKYDGDQCFCDDKDDCNSGARSIVGAFFLIISSVIICKLWS